MLSLTDTAVAKFKAFLTDKGRESDGIRIFLVPGG